MERYREKTRQALIRAAYDLIMENGYERLTIGAIAERANYGRSTFYLHFADKEDLVWAIMQQHFDAENQRIDGEILQAESPLREYLGWLAMFKDVARNAEFYRRLEGTTAAALWERTRQYLLIQTQINLETGKYSAYIPLPIEFMARFIVGATLEVMRWWAEHDYAQSPEAISQMLYLMIFRELPVGVENAVIFG